jgi:hypothetical protein
VRGSKRVRGDKALQHPPPKFVCNMLHNYPNICIFQQTNYIKNLYLHFLVHIRTSNFQHDMALTTGHGETPNERDDAKTRLRKTKNFLKEYLRETSTIVCKIYNIKEFILRSSLKCPQNRQHGGQNKILQPFQEIALYHFICALL